MGEFTFADKKSKKTPPKTQAAFSSSGVNSRCVKAPCQLLIAVLALLVSYSARCLASRLARCLAFATAAVFNSLFDIFGLDSFDSIHCKILLKIRAWFIVPENIR